MAGYSEFYVIGGFSNDGVNPIEMMILVGNSSRQWYTPHYFDASIKPLGSLDTLIPQAPSAEINLLDACIAFYPQKFAACPSLKIVEAAVKDKSRLDFDQSQGHTPNGWNELREEARPYFAEMHIWLAQLGQHFGPKGPVG